MSALALLRAGARGSHLWQRVQRRFVLLCLVKELGPSTWGACARALAWAAAAAAASPASRGPAPAVRSPPLAAKLINAWRVIARPFLVLVSE